MVRAPTQYGTQPRGISSTRRQLNSTTQPWPSVRRSPTPTHLRTPQHRQQHPSVQLVRPRGHRPVALCHPLRRRRVAQTGRLPDEGRELVGRQGRQLAAAILDDPLHEGGHEGLGGAGDGGGGLDLFGEPLEEGDDVVLGAVLCVCLGGGRERGRGVERAGGGVGGLRVVVVVLMVMMGAAWWEEWQGARRQQRAMRPKGATTWEAPAHGRQVSPGRLRWEP